MKISNSTSNNIYKAYAPPRPPAGSGQQAKTDNDAAPGLKADSINLSEKTRLIGKIAKAADVNAPDRQQRIDELRQQVQQNQYTVDATRVADSLIGLIVNGPA